MGKIAFAFGYSTEYILEHSLGWFIWAARSAEKQRRENALAFLRLLLPSPETLEETEDNLTNIGIKYE